MEKQVNDKSVDLVMESTIKILEITKEDGAKPFLAVFNVISEIYLSALTRGYEDALELFQEKIDEQKESISNRN